MEKPSAETLEYLNLLPVCDYLKETRGVDLRESAWDWFGEWGMRNDAYFWVPPIADPDWADSIPGDIRADIAALYEEFPAPDGLHFYVSW